MSSKTVAIIVNEKETDDSKTLLTFLQTHLNDLNVTIKECCISSSINGLVSAWGKSCDIVIITGKLDVISRILANLFNEKLILSNHLASIYKKTENTHNLVLPNTSFIFQIHQKANGVNPVYVKYRNFIIFPNDVTSVKAIVSNLVASLIITSDMNENYCKRYILKCDQNGRTNCIQEEIQRRNDMSVHIIQFCVVSSDNGCQLNLLVNSSEFNNFIRSDAIIKKMLPKHALVSETINEQFWNGLNVIQKEKCVQDALQIIRKCFTEYKPEDVFLSFNGGKDCTVLLYLTGYVLKKLHPDYKEKLLCLYIQSLSPFEEVENFIEQCKLFYNLDVVIIRSTVKVGLSEILKQKSNLKACLIGTRRTDPYSQHLNHFQMTDMDWPQVMRISPILDWKYCEVWHFLRTCKVPYCSLYDLGYTSLGSKTNTTPNPELKVKEHVTGKECFLPAYKLQDETKERCGRSKS